MCIQEGLKAANINRNGENGITARLAEVNSQHKNNQLRRNALSGKIIENTDVLYYEITLKCLARYVIAFCIIQI